MIDEVIYMQNRLFRMFQEQFGLTARTCKEIFDAGDIWDFITECYDALHLSGDDAALDDVCRVLSNRGIAWH